MKGQFTIQSLVMGFFMLIIFFFILPALQDIIGVTLLDPLVAGDELTSFAIRLTPFLVFIVILLAVFKPKAQLE